LEEFGVKTIRFSNSQVENKLEEVVDEIKRTILERLG